LMVCLIKLLPESFDAPSLCLRHPATVPDWQRPRVLLLWESYKGG
jgi:hypothetical protein